MEWSTVVGMEGEVSVLKERTPHPTDNLYLSER